MNGDVVALTLAVLSAVGLVVTIAAVPLVPGLQLRGWMKPLCYGAIAFIILCLALLLLGMTWGLASDWPEGAKAAMVIGFFMAVPAFVGSLLLVAAGLRGSGTAKGCFIGLGIVGMLLFALPALVMTMMASPGHP